ncbi:S8 family serine peptidase [Flavobacterium cellulosilyticum]|uniref:T9SS type A sorting domain-containing protein n=1 Tax=Flavobacterium cellulosilyticum TaxID=2541731 RepID=A0A4R5CEJ4_9FLAO|nr:S8 family serine peptidase [Flavobacterium cellulosilyticum]TDD98471.1 T9SS type A sorting domain-containing protein [Flavobacterium cellulosilyticum]
MKKLFLFLFLIASFAGFSQEDAWVYFKDKPNSATYLSSPLTMLTQRALDRRTNQGIALDNVDVPIYQPYIDQVIASNGITVKAKSKWLNCVHVRGSQADINALKLVSSVLRVDYADRSLNSTKRTTAKLKSKLVNKVLETAVNYNYGSSANQIQMLNGHLLHQLNYTGNGKIIAVLDAGFPGVNTALPYKRLRDNNQILGGYDYVNKSAIFYSGSNHGTNVLSSMGGYVDGQLIGTAPDAQYYLFITEDSASENPVEESNWVEAAEEADRLGVDIISTSLGYFAYDNPNYSHTYADMIGNLAFASQGANIAFNKGIIVVASAGNEGLATEKHIGIPAEANNVIAVGAVKPDRTYATFSSIGPSYDLRVKPDVMAQGQTVVLSDPNGNIVTANGTSFACPITAGMVACLWQAFPSKTNIQIKQLITQSADRFSAPTNQFGYGIPDFNLALSNGLSVEELLNDELAIYPNPTNDFVSFNLPKNIDTKNIYIYSLTGQKVIEENTTTQLPIISLKTLNSGIYFYKIESNGYLKTGKIIKQ